MRETSGHNTHLSEHSPRPDTLRRDDEPAPWEATAALVRKALRRTIMREWDLFVPDAAPHDAIRTAPATAITSALAGHLRPLARAYWGDLSVDCGYHRRWDLVAHRRSADPRARQLCMQVAVAGDGDWHALLRQATASGYRSAALLDLDLRAFPGEGLPITPRWRWLGQPSFTAVFDDSELGELLTLARERAGRMRARSGQADALPTSPPSVVRLPDDAAPPAGGTAPQGEAGGLRLASAPTVDRREAVSAAGHTR